MNLGATAQAIPASEIGFFSGTVLVLLWANADAPIFTKPAADSVLFSVGYTIEASGEPSNLTTTISPFPVATPAQARAGLSNNTFMTPLRTAQAIAAQIVQATTSALGLVRLASNNQADALEGQANQEVVVTPHIWWRMFTGARIVARIASNSILSEKIRNLDASKLIGIISVGRLPTVPVNRGGTGATNASRARANLEIENFPVGALVQFAGAASPAGWALCNGAAVSRTSAAYRALFTAIGTAYGAGDGATTFNLPDMRGRVPVGAGGAALVGAGLDSLGEKAGAATHTLSVQEMPSHDHDFIRSSTGTRMQHGIGTVFGSNVNSFDLIENTGGGRPHNNIQPSIVVNYIIKL